jgi:hypothetical protein
LTDTILLSDFPKYVNKNIGKFKEFDEKYRIGRPNKTAHENVGVEPNQPCRKIGVVSGGYFGICQWFEGAVQGISIGFTQTWG